MVDRKHYPRIVETHANLSMHRPRHWDGSGTRPGLLCNLRWRRRERSCVKERPMDLLSYSLLLLSPSHGLLFVSKKIITLAPYYKGLY